MEDDVDGTGDSNDGNDGDDGVLPRCAELICVAMAAFKFYSLLDNGSEWSGKSKTSELPRTNHWPPLCTLRLGCHHCRSEICCDTPPREERHRWS